ncbi:12S rRNA N4-methylcytidine (m4C) methyltransferase isoform X7 [Canis lupus familiaris]|nr:12S rRNA N4-methylcytidine (m4C) methyltransferase isoform X7 [Canis lupus familiaris]XP_038312193.1 12S rRNA N4-methylcytidine (m4C) methyltransferase isoform X7 [Canis lupus familiaris]XP_038312194.1 12S rRNA N4-methylcytidine (m4C) methyltransferase isoform X7 [Canis lupus familiaris]
MLRYPYFCRLYKEFLSCWWESGIFNSGVWPKRIHDTAQRYNECEAREQTDQTGTQEMHRPQDRDNEAVTKLHIPVMVDEVVRCLAPQKGQIFLDMTFGSGGHTRAILQKESDITLYALDRDPTAYAIAEQLSELYPKQIRALLGQFSQAEALLMKAGVQPGTLDGVLLDPGCSSMQLDAPERGFSLRKDGPLDMRMDGGRYPDMPTAADVVNALDQQALASILRTYGEEKHAKKIASAIVQARSLYPISRTQQLASIVAGILINSEQCLRGEKIYIYISPPNSQRDSFVLKIMHDRILRILFPYQLSFGFASFPPSKPLSPTQFKKIH